MSGGFQPLLETNRFRKTLQRPVQASSCSVLVFLFVTPMWLIYYFSYFVSCLSCVPHLLCLVCLRWSLIPLWFPICLWYLSVHSVDRWVRLMTHSDHNNNAWEDSAHSKQHSTGKLVFAIRREHHGAGHLLSSSAECTRWLPLSCFPQTNLVSAHVLILVAMGLELFILYKVLYFSRNAGDVLPIPLAQD